MEVNVPPLVYEAEGIAASGGPAWNWRETPSSGRENESAYNGRLISVKWEESTRRIGVDGSFKAIKEAIKSAFGLRTNRTFWLEDKDGVIQSLDRDMPLRNYTLHLDKGLAIKICSFNEPNNRPVHIEEKTLYNEDDFLCFLNRCGWIGLKDIRCFKNVDTIEELHPGEIFQAILVRVLPEKEEEEESMRVPYILEIELMEAMLVLEGISLL